MERVSDRLEHGDPARMVVEAYMDGKYRHCNSDPDIGSHPCEGVCMKLKTCKQCKSRFVPARPLQVVCGPLCGLERAKKTRVVQEKKQDRVKREKLMTYSERKARAQKAVNEFIRERDYGKPCISCATPWEPTFQAGHFRSRGAAPQLALDRRNIAGQCIRCNLHLHGNQLSFRAGLIAREGEDHVRAVEAENEPLKLTHEELQQITIINKADAKALRKARDAT